MITSKHASLVVLAGLLGVVTTQQGCGSDTSGPTGGAMAGSTAMAGAASGVSGGGSSGMASTAAGAPAAGAPAAGAPAAGAPATGGGGSGGTGGTGGSSAGAGGSSAGAGGSRAGAGGSSAGAGGGSAGSGGGSAVTFAQIKTIFSASCGTGQCHNKASGQLDYQGTTDLHSLLTTAIPATGVAHCNGTTLVTPNNAAGSFLVTVVTGPGKVTCKKNGTDEMISRMPDNCSTSGGMPACLSAAQIKTISDWIGAGAPG